MKRGIIRNNSFYDLLVFRKIHQTLGGRVRLILTGAAPIAAKTLGFLRCVFGCVVLEGYGQTEATCCATMTVPGDFESGHVGIPFCCNEVKLVDVPEMNYFAAQDTGEICFRGANVFLGYFKNPKITQETVDSDGWLHSGDIGKWLPNGTLKIIDRKKALFKLAQGEYIAPEKIENIYVRHSLVAQAFVWGDSHQSALVGIFVVDEAAVESWMQKNNLPKQSVKEVCKSPALIDFVLKGLTDLGKQNGLNNLEQVRAIYLSADPFTVENDLLTPTFKSKRNNIQKRYAEEIARLCDKIKAIEDQQRKKENAS